MIKKLIKYIYNKYLHHKNVDFFFDVNIGVGSKFEGANKIWYESEFVGNMGYGSYIGCNSKIHASIGRFTSIASGCKTVSGIHPTTFPYVSTSPMFFSLLNQTGKTFANNQTFVEEKFANEENKIPVIIGSDCWICENVTIIAGVTIGDGAVVLTNAVVTKNIPPYAIVSGVPAKTMKYRYDDETIKFLLDTQWWKKDVEWLKNHVEFFNDIKSFKKLFNSK